MGKGKTVSSKELRCTDQPEPLDFLGKCNVLAIAQIFRAGHESWMFERADVRYCGMLETGGRSEALPREALALTRILW